MARYNPRDRFFQKAKSDQYAARSVYKLEEIDRRFKLIKKGMAIVDLGSSPGSWLQYLSKQVEPTGMVVGYDLVEPSVFPGPRSRAFVADVDQLTAPRIVDDLEKLSKELGAPLVDVAGLISDMAPKLTGVRDADQVRSVALAQKALQLSIELVRPGGFFVAKLFQGRETDELVKEVKLAFSDTRMLKPEATRDGSREVFVIGPSKR
jgi:23S rRNA (uridine2552-2'-O)-methyltransferase